jgi:hypothetical protein
MRCYGISKIGLRLLNVFRDFWQIGQLQRGAVRFNDFHQIYSVEVKLIVFHSEFLGWEIKGLLDQIDVSVHVQKWSL